MSHQTDGFGSCVECATGERHWLFDGRCLTHQDAYVRARLEASPADERAYIELEYLQEELQRAIH